MRLPPGPDPLHFGRTPEIAPVLRPTPPTRLPSPLARLLARGRRTVDLVMPVPWVRPIYLPAMRTLASASSLHAPASRRWRPRLATEENKPRSDRGKKTEEDFMNDEFFEEDTGEEHPISNRRFQPSFISPLTKGRAQRGKAAQGGKRLQPIRRYVLLWPRAAFLMSFHTGHHFVLLGLWDTT